MGDEIHPEPRLPLYFGYTQTHNLCDQLRERVVEKYHPARVEQNSVGAVVGTHVGPDGAVVVYLDQAAPFASLAEGAAFAVPSRPASPWKAAPPHLWRYAPCRLSREEAFRAAHNFFKKIGPAY